MLGFAGVVVNLAVLWEDSRRFDCLTPACITCLLPPLLYPDETQYKRADACPSSQGAAKPHRPGTNAALRLRQYCAVYLLQLRLAVLWECAHYCFLDFQAPQGSTELFHSITLVQLMIVRHMFGWRNCNPSDSSVQYKTGRSPIA